MAWFRNRLFAVITIVAFGVAALGTLLPEHAAAAHAVAAKPCPMAMDMSFGHDGHHPAMPPNCIEGAVCIVMAALPVANSPSATPLTWTPVQYGISSDSRVGVTVSPDPSPPKSRA